MIILRENKTFFEIPFQCKLNFRVPFWHLHCNFITLLLLSCLFLRSFKKGVLYTTFFQHQFQRTKRQLLFYSKVWMREISISHEKATTQQLRIHMEDLFIQSVSIKATNLDSWPPNKPHSMVYAQVLCTSIFFCLFIQTQSY